VATKPGIYIMSSSLLVLKAREGDEVPIIVRILLLLLFLLLVVSESESFHAPVVVGSVVHNNNNNNNNNSNAKRKFLLPSSLSIHQQQQHGHGNARHHHPRYQQHENRSPSSSLIMNSRSIDETETTSTLEEAVTTTDIVVSLHKATAPIYAKEESSTTTIEKTSFNSTATVEQNFFNDHDTNNGIQMMNPLADFNVGSSTDDDNDDDDDDTTAVGVEVDTKGMAAAAVRTKQKGLLTIGLITFLFSTNSPVLHGAFTTTDHPPPVLLVNAAVSCVALIGLLLGGETLEKTQTQGKAQGSQSQQERSSRKSTSTSMSRSNSNKKGDNNDSDTTTTLVAGVELGIWKFIGTTCNLFGLAYTTASHGALLIQLTTVMVPLTRAVVYKETIPDKVKLSIVLAVIGVVCFATATDPTAVTTTNIPTLKGDLFCIGAAICYSAYDIRLYEYGKKVNPKPLITTKIATQAFLSCFLLLVSTLLTALSTTSMMDDTIDAPLSLFSSSSSFSMIQESFVTNLDVSSVLSQPIVIGAILWSGIAVNAVAPFLQVEGQQIIGPTKCQTIYASQPLWAAVISFLVLGETLGYQGMVGGGIFVAALILAAGADTTTATTTASTTALTESVETETI